MPLSAGIVCWHSKENLGCRYSKKNRENPTLEPDALAELLMLSAISLLENKFVQCTDIAPARQRSNKFVSALAYSQCSQTFLSLPSLTPLGHSVSFVENPRPFGLKNRLLLTVC